MINYKNEKINNIPDIAIKEKLKPRVEFKGWFKNLQNWFIGFKINI